MGFEQMPAGAATKREPSDLERRQAEQKEADDMEQLLKQFRGKEINLTSRDILGGDNSSGWARGGSAHLKGILELNPGGGDDFVIKIGTDYKGQDLYAAISPKKVERHNTDNPDELWLINK